MSSKPALSPEVLRSQEAAFIEHYHWLIRWALQLTGNNRAHAEDLVQEVFAQLAFRHTDLSSVHNIPAYLYTTLRNIHVSEIRLAGRTHIQMPSVVEFGVAATALSACNPQDLYQAQDELRRICYYACVRKQSSRAGSVMILRFFFGYHLSEVALVLGGSYQAVRQCLRFARNEARTFLDNPNALAFIERGANPKGDSHYGVRGAEDLLADLRLAIFRSNQGECLHAELLRAFYQKNLIATANNALLAHVVSCRDCLDTANRVLNLPLLSERHPADALGPDNSTRRGPGAPSGSGAERQLQFGRRHRDREGEISNSFLLRCRRRARELFEHHPRELCVSVNGHLLGSQCVNSEISRLRLDVTIPEALSFVEVLSEEKARLLLMSIEEPPNGEPTQAKHVALSEGRHIEVTLRYGHPFPMLEVEYRDPNFAAEAEADETWAQDLSDASDANVAQLEASAGFRPSLVKRFIGAVSVVLLSFLRAVSLIGRPLLTRPSTITAIVSVFVIGVFLYLRLNIAPTVSAASLIERANAAEQALNGVSDRAIHRVINLEERIPAGALIARSRIEIWRDKGRERSVRRVFDEQGRLIAGEWSSTKDGAAARRIYRRGGAPRVESPISNPEAAIRDAELWQLEPSAAEYAALVGQMDAARVSEDSAVYIVSYAAGQQASRDSTLVGATLTLRKSDFHPVEQTLSVQRGGAIHEYRLVEAGFEQQPVQAVAPGVFEIDPELVSKVEDGKLKRESNALQPSVVNAPLAVMATPELEVEVAYLLDQFRVLVGDQVNLTRTPEGLLRVDGVVETNQLKHDVLRALSPVANNPAVRIQIRTVAEALATQRRHSPDAVIVREFSETDNAMPAYADLYRYFAQRDGKDPASRDDRIDQEVRALAARVVGRSRRVLSHAIELRQLKERFSVAQLQVLTPSSQTKLFGMLQDHAESLRREVALLEQELGPILLSKTYDRENVAGEISSLPELTTAIERLYKLAAANDEIIRSAFTASSGASSTASLKAPRFHGSLIAVEKLAGAIRQAATSLESHE